MKGKNMGKKTISALCASALLLGMLSGCADSKTEESMNSSTTESSAKAGGSVSSADSRNSKACRQNVSE